MAITERDLELYAARVRWHFPPELRDTAFNLAYSLACRVGPKVKGLRPETPLDEIIYWLGPLYVQGKDSLDNVEKIIAMEVDLGSAFVLPDELASRADTVTFLELVRHVARKEGLTMRSSGRSQGSRR